jgi:peptide-methionine (S)-S-oxide reductase
MATLPDPALDLSPADDPPPARIVLAGGCFWCTEAVFLQLDGVLGVQSGYAGGTADTANYEAVCGGRTNHAEAIEIRYDPARVSLGTLLKVFFGAAHDPTQKDRQGHDRGRQYRSAIFFEHERQKEVAAAYIRQLDAARVFDAPIATTLEPLEGFFPAEAYHQNYAARNPGQPYILFTALPKVGKVHEAFAKLVRKD